MALLSRYHMLNTVNKIDLRWKSMGCKHKIITGLKRVDLLMEKSQDKIQSPILVANIGSLSEDLPWIVTCPENIQKLLVLNQPGIILNLDY
jgi:hypothetical protein